ncbi:acyltransferase family protein [Candidatus Pantoea multigeneris]|uniref:Acyltransferase n=1 Tax=Candidatus Pantoea multigeneris TaxID=2608357 RepID=A0ABX0R8M6_9GAMM|nr:acyltransferase [Pantoea multigeneris]NIF21725.1 acyltransferase [Pantoea multigeneris]
MTTNYSAKHDNSFDIIRLLAAVAVIYSHHFALSGFSEPQVLGLESFGTTAVIIFFSISGYLIAQSYQRSSSDFEYARKRFLRVYPGLAVCLVFTIYICGGLLGSESFLHWVTSWDALKTWLRVMGLTGIGFVGVTPEGMNNFTNGYIYPNTMNGSLWTLFFEVFDYIVLAFCLKWFSRYNAGLWIFLVGSVVLQLLCLHFGITKLALVATSHFSIPFAVGALFCVYRDRWINNPKVKVVLLVVALIALLLSGLDVILVKTLYTVAVCYLTLLIGISFRDRLIKGRFDFSYGIYIYAFPVQQIAINELGIGFWSSMLLSLLVTLVMAALSWFLIEKPMIGRKKSRVLVRATE